MLAVRVEVSGIAAHGSTPWLGDNAILKAHDVFRRIETLPFSRESSDLFDRPSINLARIDGGDAFNKVPDLCTMDVDIRFLPNQDPGEILAQIRAMPRRARSSSRFERAPAIVSRANPYVRRCARRSRSSIEGDALSVGRDGASDAISFLEAGIPAVEFGPVGGGHHGPEEWVSIASLARYRAGAGRLRASACRAVARRRRRATPPLRADRGRPGVSSPLPEPRRAAASELPRAYPTWPDPIASRPGAASSSAAARLILLLTATAVASAVLLEVNEVVDSRSHARATPIPGVKNVLDDVDGRRPADDPGARLRPRYRTTARATRRARTR